MPIPTPGPAAFMPVSIVPTSKKYAAGKSTEYLAIYECKIPGQTILI